MEGLGFTLANKVKKKINIHTHQTNIKHMVGKDIYVK